MIDALYFVAEGWKSVGDYENAIDNYNDIIKNYPDLADIYKTYHNKGLCLSMLGQYNAAIECYDAALSQKYNTTTAFSKAYALYKLKKYSDTLNLLDSAIEQAFIDNENLCSFISFYEKICNRMYTLLQPLQSSQNEHSGVKNAQAIIPSDNSTSDNQHQLLLGSIVGISMSINENN